MTIANEKCFLPLKFFIPFIIFISCLHYNSNAQRIKTRYATKADLVIDSAKRRIASKSCNQISSYIPDTLHPEFTPMRYVRINIHVIQDGNGQNNFSGPEGRKWVKGIVESANQRLASNQKMFLPHGNNTPVLQIPFRYVLTGDPHNPN